MVKRVDEIAREFTDGVGTVGLIENRPNSRNVIPGEVFFSVDFRHPEEKILYAMETKLHAVLTEILRPLQLTYEATRTFTSPPVKFSPARRLRSHCSEERRLRLAKHDFRRRP